MFRVWRLGEGPAQRRDAAGLVAGVRVQVGEVSVRFDGEVSIREIRALLRLATSLNLACLAEVTPVEGPSQVFGFGAQVERSPETILSEDLSWYFDE